jgi:hypothetical protein
MANKNVRDYANTNQNTPDEIEPTTEIISSFCQKVITQANRWTSLAQIAS